VTFVAKHVSMSIDRSTADVYMFASNPLNLPRWAAGLSGSIEQIDGAWFADSPMGRVQIAFAATNDFGVLDHDVTLPSGETVRNAFRVIANGDGSELVFTLYQRPGMSVADFEADASTVENDLLRLKSLLEA
jgi:hypothetical protein